MTILTRVHRRKMPKTTYLAQNYLFGPKSSDEFQSSGISRMLSWAHSEVDFGPAWTSGASASPSGPRRTSEAPSCTAPRRRGPQVIVLSSGSKQAEPCCQNQHRGGGAELDGDRQRTQRSTSPKDSCSGKPHQTPTTSYPVGVTRKPPLSLHS